MKYPMILIKWLDACQYLIPGSEQSLKSVLEIAKLKEITDIGFLLEKTEEKIVFCSKIVGENKFDKVSAVPMGWVKELVDLTVDVTNGEEIKKEKTETIYCMSYYDDNNVLQDCTCGKCK